ncbi:hypothetical protein [Anaplasma phagocytophilum]|uniref:hypothetical protein n=1 Tax=Anaplasma phagocytophilum TaxID=948 RepID=UPI00123E1DFF|nr:hypothetical protein [Anaplasma phagocytophilum]
MRDSRRGKNWCIAVQIFRAGYAVVGVLPLPTDVLLSATIWEYRSFYSDVDQSCMQSKRNLFDVNIGVVLAGRTAVPSLCGCGIGEAREKCIIKEAKLLWYGR